MDAGIRTKRTAFSGTFRQQYPRNVNAPAAEGPARPRRRQHSASLRSGAEWVEKPPDGNQTFVKTPLFSTIPTRANGAGYGSRENRAAV